NTTVTNTSTLDVGTHVIRCTVTKSTGTSANAQTTIVVNAAYTGVPNRTYNPGETISFANVSWKVIKDNGTNITLITSNVIGQSRIYQFSAITNYLNNWLTNNTVLNSAKNDGGLILVDTTNYIRIPTYEEVNEDYSGSKLWYSGSYWTSTVSYYTNDYYGGIRNYYVVSGSYITTKAETSSCSYSGCSYTTYEYGVRPIIIIRKM
ncbi:MAG TPA: hypothetical protein GX747_04100, partial [Tenericutes bacterium]|nr:hypothetical protein [Mycoplasmatota bacterium]